MSDYQTMLVDQKLRNSQALLESCNSVMSFQSYNPNDLQNSTRKPVRATRDAVNFEYLKRKIRMK